MFGIQEEFQDRIISLENMLRRLCSCYMGELPPDIKQWYNTQLEYRQQERLRRQK